MFEPGIAAHLGLSITAEGVFVVVPHLPAGIDRGGAARDARAPPRPAAARFGELSALVLHADGARLHAPARPGGDRLRLHGRAVRIPWRAGRARAARDRAVAGGRRGVHRRPQPLRGQAQPATPTSTPSRAASTWATSARRASCSATRPTRRASRHPRLGFFGVIDERMDLRSVEGVATVRPDWQIVMLGPTAKIDLADLPRQAEHPLPRPEVLPRSAPLSRALGRRAAAVRAGTSRRATSARRRRPSTWRPAVRSSRPRSGTWSGPTATRGWCASPTRSRTSCAQCEAAMADRKDARWRRDGRRRCSARCPGTAPGATWPRSSTRPSSSRLRPGTGCGVGTAADDWGGVTMVDYLVVGAGFAGAVLAERLASAGQRVLVVEKRNHIGGNAYDHYDEAGVLVHKYGPHIFHTNSQGGLRLPVALHAVALLRASRAGVGRRTAGADPDQPRHRQPALRPEPDAPRSCPASSTGWREPREPLRTSEDVVVSKVGRDLYRKFFQGYTRKQWGLDPSELDASVTARDPDPHQPRRPLFHRHLPVHAGARLHADVRAHAGPPEHQRRAADRLPRGRVLGPLPEHDLHRADRRVLRPLLRPAAVPLARVRARDARQPQRSRRPAPSTTRTSTPTRGSPSSST